MTSVEEVTARRHRATQALRALFLSPVGKDIIAVLESEFRCEKLKGKDPYETYYRIGQHEALQTFIKLGDSNE